MLKLRYIFDSGRQPAPPFEKQVNAFFEESGLRREDIIHIQYDIAPTDEDFRAVYIIYEEGGHPE